MHGINETGYISQLNKQIKKKNNDYQKGQKIMCKKRISKDDYYLELAKCVSLRSTCLKRMYGAVIVKNDEVVATGYNGSARGEVNCCDIHRECPRKNKPHNSGDYSDCPAVHAEQNALISVSRNNAIGSTLYLSGREYDENGEPIDMTETHPCPICARMIKNAGITRIVGPQGDITL